MTFLKKYWPLLLGAALFVSVSLLTRAYTPQLIAVFHGDSSIWSIVTFVVLGIILVMIPTGSILPLMPLAVTLWGWPAAGVLTLLSWVIGGQLLFELTRVYGRRFVAKFQKTSSLQKIGRKMANQGFTQSLFMRIFLHGDLVSYAFGLFSNISSLKYFFVSLFGMAPMAFIYAYMGSLPLSVQLMLFGCAGLGLVISWMLKEHRISFGNFTRFLKTRHA